MWLVMQESYRVVIYERKDVTEEQLTSMRDLFVRTRAGDPHFQTKAKERNRSIVELLSDKFEKSTTKDHLYFFVLHSPCSPPYPSATPPYPLSSEPAEVSHTMIGFTIAERDTPTSVYVSRTTIDPKLQNAGMGKAMARSLGAYFEHEVIWGFVNEKQVAVRRFWEVLGAKVTPASAVQVKKVFKNYVIYSYRARL